MLLLHTYSEQMQRFSVSVEAHLNAGRTVSREVLANKSSLEFCRRRLTLAQELSRSQAVQIAQLDRILSLLEAESPDLTAAAAVLNHEQWSHLAIPESLAEMQSFACNQTLADEDLVLALLSDEELTSVRSHLSRPTFERLRWSKGDYLVVTACVTLGLAIEIVNAAWKPGGPIDTDGQVRKWFNEKMHSHAPDNPIDYQGYGFGGGFHRARTRGHDLARFLEAVRQTAEGVFRGRRWHNRTPIEVVSELNQNGKAYPRLDWWSALVNVIIHLIADFFSTHSLPLPLTSVVYDFCGREFRKFVLQLYEEGFHLRHVTLGAIEVFLSYVGIEVWLWLQYGTDARKTPPVSLKRAEMRTSVMGLLSGANLAGCALLQNPFFLNIPTVIAAVDSARSLRRLNRQRNHWIYREGRNLDDLAAIWESTHAEICPPEKRLLEDQPLGQGEHQDS